MKVVWSGPKGMPGHREMRVFKNDGVTFVARTIIDEQSCSAAWLEVEPEYRGQGVSQAMQEFYYNEYPENYSQDFSYVIDGSSFICGKTTFTVLPSMRDSLIKFHEMKIRGESIDTTIDPT